MLNEYSNVYVIAIVNYSDPKGYGASSFIDLPNGNASTRFCLSSDCIPQPEFNMFKPCLRIF